MTVLPAIPEAPVQAAPPSRSSQSSNDQSNDFYNYLRSHTHDDSEEADQNVRETDGKPQKREKQTDKAAVNKTDKDQATDATTAPVQAQNQQPAPPPISIEALLGLPIVSPGKANNSDTVPDAKSTSSDAAASTQKNRTPVAANINPALLIANAPQFLNIDANPTDSSKVDPTNKIGSAVSNEVIGVSNEVIGNDVPSLIAGAASSAAANGTAAATAAQGNLAFALKLSDGSLNSPSQKPNEISPQAPPEESIAGVAPSASTDFAATVLAAAGSQLKEQSHEQGNAETVLYGSSPAQSQNIVGDPQHTTHEGPAHTTAADLEAKPDTSTAEPVRNVHMQVVGDNNNRVDVQLMDRGGALHVSVKSGDVNLAQSLQDHMPELTSRLEQQRFQAEVWMPKLGDNAKPEMSGSRDFSSGGNNSSNTRDSSDQQGKGQQQYKPDWVDVFENSTRGGGKINQTWHQ